MIVMQKLSNDDQIVQPNLIANGEIYIYIYIVLENIATNCKKKAKIGLHYWKILQPWAPRRGVQQKVEESI